MTLRVPQWSPIQNRPQLHRVTDNTNVNWNKVNYNKSYTKIELLTPFIKNQQSLPIMEFHT